MVTSTEDNFYSGTEDKSVQGALTSAGVVTDSKFFRLTDKAEEVFRFGDPSFIFGNLEGLADIELREIYQTESTLELETYLGG